MIFKFHTNNGGVLDPQCVTKSEPQDSKEDTPNADDDTDSSGTPCNKGMSRSERHAGCSVGGDDDSGYVQMMS